MGWVSLCLWASAGALPASGTDFFVNDASTANDVYTTAPGNSTNTGTADNPWPNLRHAIANAALAPGDRIFVDTGTYVTNARISVEDSGTAGNPISIIGSTNIDSSARTLLESSDNGVEVMRLLGVDFVHLAHLRFKGGKEGLLLNTSDNGIFSNLVLEANSTGIRGAGAFDHAFRRCLLLNNLTGISADNTGWSWDHGVANGNGTAFSVNPGTLSVSNSVVVGGTAFSDSGPDRGDYTVFSSTSLGIFTNLVNFQKSKSTNQWRHSIVASPSFAGGGDFHPQSTAGRFDPSSGNFVTDSVTSILIDFGDPAAPFGNETPFNAGRLNAGLFGNTVEASRSPTNAALLAMTLNDGGTLSVPGDSVFWNYRNMPVGATVRVELSRDAGENWNTAVTGIPATNGTYVWVNTNFASSLFARWRVVLESDTNVLDATDNNFIFRSGPFEYFVNDSDLSGDIYTFGPGDDGNLGIDPNEPKATLQNVLATYDIEPGDRIFIDTGEYILTSDIEISSDDSGTVADPVTILGSTNLLFGGTVLDRGGTGAGKRAVEFIASPAAAHDIILQDVTVQNGEAGVFLNSSDRIVLERVIARNNGEAGFQMRGSATPTFRHCASRNNGMRGLFVEPVSGTAVVRVENSVFWQNDEAGVRVDSGTVTISNSVVVASGEDRYAYYAANPGNIVGNYNDLLAEEGALIGFLASLSRNVDTLSAWSGLTGFEQRSLSAEPLFLNPANDDFHLKSEAGHFDRVSGAFVADAVTSPLIDAGDPASPFDNELADNGGRINIGMFGNTAEASKSITNRILRAASLTEGGWVKGVAELHWVAYNLTGADTVTVEFSPDGGQSWSVLTNATAATNEAFSWNTLTTNDTPAGLWRVTSDGDPSVSDQTTNFFAVRNAGLDIHINDGSTAGDTFTTAPGAPTNFVASVSQPFDSLARAFVLYDLEPGDRVFVDTGSYSNSVNAELGIRDSGISTSLVQVIGSTNACAGGAVLDGGGLAESTNGLFFRGAEWIAVSNLAVQSAGTGIRVEHSKNLMLGFVRSRFNGSNGLWAVNSTNVTFRRSVARENAGFGLATAGGQGLRVLKSVIWSNALGAIQQTGGDTVVSNSVLTASGPSALIYDLSTNALLKADFNDLLPEDLARVAVQGPVSSRSVIQWNLRTTNDVHSLNGHPPGFVDAANGDFHARSTVGRFDPCAGLVTDATNAFLIDTGDPDADRSREPLPNGSRVNVGLYGNHPEASLSRTNGFFVTLTLNSVGIISGTNDLFWVAGGVATGHQVFIDFSADDGVTWTNVATNLSASAGVFSDWDTLLVPSTTRGRWRITSQSDASVSTVNGTPFILNNEGVEYFVNDGSTVGDVFTQGAGDPNNDGLTEGSPVNSIATVLTLYDLREGDRVLIDTGVYDLPTDLLIDDSVSGVATNPVVLQGSTNGCAGGTVLDRQGGPIAIHVRDTGGVGLRHLRIRDAQTGVRFFNATNVFMEWVSVEGGQLGIEAFNVVGEFPVRHSSVSEAEIGVRNEDSATLWEHGVLWSNKIGVSIEGGSVSVSNSVISVFGTGNTAYNLLEGSLASDFNDLMLTNGALPEDSFENVSRWARDTERDVHSLTQDPLFVDPADGDFHVRSLAGRFDPVLCATVSDLVSSVLIDAGDPLGVFTNELEPNGDRVNIGLYGNSQEASRTTTLPSLTTISLNDGGRAEGTNVPLRWVARGLLTGQFVRVEFSGDGGESWSVIQSNVLAADSAVAWDTTQHTSTMKGVWAVMSQSQTTVLDRTDRLFAVRNDPIVFYVNDASTNGDVFTVAPGSPTNDGLSAATPKASLQAVFDVWDVEPGDTILVDTGQYSPTGTVGIGLFDRGDGPSRVLVQGSTNEAAGGSVLNGFGLELNGAPDLTLRNLEIVVPPTLNGVAISSSSNCVLEWVRVQGGSRAFVLNGSSACRLNHCVAHSANVGLEAVGSANTTWESGVLWSNVTAVQLSGGNAAVSNSVIGAFGPGRLAYSISDADLHADFNDLYLTDAAQAALEAALPFGIQFENVARWARDRAQDVHSLTHDPGFHDAPGADFHLLSQAGRFDPLSGTVTNDAESSLLIDSGDPTVPFGQEPLPNGGRVNIGLYGNTSEASQSPTNAGLTAVTLNDGGRAEGTDWELYWVASGDATGHAVRLEYSSDGGLTWTNIVGSNLPPGTSTFIWNTTNFTSSILGLWRISSTVDTNVFDQSDDFFALRNEPLDFYVNDDSTSGDVFTQAIGASTNLGVSPLAPKDSIQDILSEWDVEPGDTIFVDTGVYSNDTDVTFGQLDAGTTNAGELVTVMGSTNFADGGTVIDRKGGGNGIRMFRAPGVHLRNLFIRNASRGVSLEDSSQCRIERVQVSEADTGFFLEESDATVFRHCAVVGSSGIGVLNDSGSALTDWQNGVLWSNATAVQVEGGSLSFFNSVIGVFGQGSLAYNVVAGGLDADYNNIYHLDGAEVARRTQVPLSDIFRTVGRWARDTGEDRHSLTHDPGFFDPATGDFHPVSEAGRWDPSASAFTNDAATSLLLDAGLPSASFTNEIPPNGARLNIGPFGNTAEASKTPTNASLTAVTLNDGGRAEGTSWELYWVARGDATGHTVRLEFSPDAGNAWQLIVTNVPATNRTFSWNTLAHPSTILGKWRVVSEADTNVLDETDELFALRNQPLAFYVNDVVTNNDVFTSASGNVNNFGNNPAAPKASVSDVLNTWDLEPGDTIFVDTGNYLIDQTISIDRFDAWDQVTNIVVLQENPSTNRVTIQGSTNLCAGGTTFIRDGGGTLFSLNNAPGVALRHLTLREGADGVDANGSDFGLIEWVRREAGTTGFRVRNTETFELLHCVAKGNVGRGLSVEDADNVTWRNGVIWSNSPGAFQDGGSLTLENSVIGALSSNTFAHFHVSGTRQSDFNAIFLTNGAFAGAEISGGVLGGGTSRFENVFFWSRDFGQDKHSLAVDPGFVDANGDDFHLLSSGGRFEPCLGFLTNDTTFSRLIDSGNPGTPVGDEPVPNGARVNIGLYGGSAEASKTPPEGWLTTITFNDGGSSQGSIPLNWVAGGDAQNQLVSLDFSSDGGLSWSNVVTDVPGGAETFLWNSVPFGRTAGGLWRITSQEDPSIAFTNDAFFTLRNGGSIFFFVNDGSTVGDVFTTTNGSPDNPGVVSFAPAASVQDVLAEFKLEPVDIIFVDTGVYPLVDPITVNDLDSGFGTNHVIIQGSTNAAAGGTVFESASGLGAAVRLVSAAGIELRDFTVRGAEIGVSIVETEDSLVHGVRAEENGAAGFLVEEAEDIVFRHSVAFNNDAHGLIARASDLMWDSGVMWGNPSALLIEQGAEATVSNSVLHAFGEDEKIYEFTVTGGDVFSDYNNLVHEDGALVAEQAQLVGGDEPFATLTVWQKEAEQDIHSLSHEPEFVSAVDGNFRLKSVTGRFLLDGTLTNDAVHSPLIDTGDPARPFTNELAPNGFNERVNVGLFGDTPAASLSRTNPWLVAVSINDGGIISGTNTLLWAAGGVATDATVRLEFSRDDGIQFELIQSNVLARMPTGFPWDVSAEPITTLGRWRVLLEGNESAADTNDVAFTIKNEALEIYVNDDETAGDIFTTTNGLAFPAHDGLSPDEPLNDPAVAMAIYPITAGDQIFVDTGEYLITNAMRLTELSRGLEGLPIRIVGSTNRQAGGSLIDGGGALSAVLDLNETRFVEVEHLRVKNADIGVLITRVEDGQFAWVEAFSNASDGIRIGSLSSPIDFVHSVAWNNGGYGLNMMGASDGSWRHGVLWSNDLAALSLAQSSLELKNSVMHSATTNSFLYEISAASLDADFNFLAREPGAAFAKENFFNFSFADLREWQVDQGVDIHSVPLDPMFFDAGGGDFHLASKAGRFDPDPGTHVLADTNTSWAIDAGDFNAASSNEPPPNGARVNVGRFGNTTEASLSVTAASERALFAVTMEDGGTASGDVRLYWLSRGFNTSDTVRLEFSPNGGIDWEEIAANQPVFEDGFIWDTTTETSTPLAVWSVTYEQDTNILDRSGAGPGEAGGGTTNLSPFILRNEPIDFFVNDSNTVGDVYTTAAGGPEKDGLTANTPKASIQGILDAYNLEGGDVVFVDTGVYTNQSETLITLIDGGSSVSSLVSVVGSTNPLAGGTVLRMANSGFEGEAGIRLFQVPFVSISHLTLENFDVGMFLDLGVQDAVVSNVVIRDGGVAGVQFGNASDNRIEHAVITRHTGVGVLQGQGDNTLNNVVIWSNGSHAIDFTGSLNVSNSVLHAVGTNRFIYRVGTNSQVRSDYNNLFVTNGANFAVLNNIPIESLPRWHAFTTQDVHSLAREPLFADLDNDDFHPRSSSGRFDPGIQDFVFTDTNTSLLIDFGSPDADASSEPLPSGPLGGRLNIGRFGNTVEASLSPTNPFLFALTADQGGRVGGISAPEKRFRLVWGWGGMEPTNRVKLEYSFDNGTNWLLIADDLAVTNGEFLWDSGQLTESGEEVWPRSPIARWRVVQEADTNLFDMTDVHFGLNGPFTFYLNDGSLVGDVFTTAVGDDENLGIASNAPKSSLSSLLDTLDVEGQDVILFDTGVYVMSNELFATLDGTDQGKPGNPVIILGSTNDAGVVLDRASVGGNTTVLNINGNHIEIERFSVLGGGVLMAGQNVTLRHFAFTNGGLTVSGSDSLAEDVDIDGGSLAGVGENLTLRRIRVIGGSVDLDGSILLENTAVKGSVSPLVSAKGTPVLRNNTIVSAGTAFQQTDPASFSTLENNIFVADGKDGEAFVILRTGTPISSDYNNLVARNGAWIGDANGKWEKLIYWQRESGQDEHSISAEPLFANEAAGDLHLKSIIGTLTNGSSGFEPLDAHSPSIDAGNPATPLAGPPSTDDGGRVNQGAFGNTEEASLSVTFPSLLAITVNDGGVLKGTNTIRWSAQNINPTNTVSLEYSADNGVTWTTIQSGVAAGDGAFAVDTTELPDSFNARWRVVLDSDTNVLDATDNAFAVRNNPQIFFVNDTNLTGDVFTFLSTGSPANDGLTPITPKASIMGVLTNYDTEALDIIRVDTGTYTNPVLVIWSDGGDLDGMMTIQGSFNSAEGGSELVGKGKGGPAGFDVKASRVFLRDFTIRNASRAVFFDSNRFSSVERIFAHDNAQGILLRDTISTTVKNIRVWNNTSGGIDLDGTRTTKVENVTSVDNVPFGYRISDTVVDELQNSIFYLSTTNPVAALSGGTTEVAAAFIDYNTYFFAPTATNAVIFSGFTNLLSWQLANGHDFRSFTNDPLFADVDMGDLHLKSTAGRFLPGVGFTNDLVNSPVIDRGNPDSDFVLEPATNGGRINMGAFGNTSQASKGSTNTVVFARVANDPLSLTSADNLVPLIWTVQNVPTNMTVSVQFSGDDGNTWIDIATGLPAEQEFILWSLDPIFNTFEGRWRVIGEAPNGDLLDVSDANIQMFFGPFEISEIQDAANQQDITWRGAWNETYQVQFADGLGPTNAFAWTNAPGGLTNLFPGGDATFTDVTATGAVDRVYRVLWEGTNGLSVQ